MRYKMCFTYFFTLQGRAGEGRKKKGWLDTCSCTFHYVNLRTKAWLLVAPTKLHLQGTEYQGRAFKLICASQEENSASYWWEGYDRRIWQKVSGNNFCAPLPSDRPHSLMYFISINEVYIGETSQHAQAMPFHQKKINKIGARANNLVQLLVISRILWLPIGGLLQTHHHLN